MYMAESGRMIRDFFFIILDLPETADSGASRHQVGEASCLQEARRHIPSPHLFSLHLPFSLSDSDGTFTIVRLKAGQMFEDPVEYDRPGFTGEVVEQKIVAGT